MQYCCTTPEPGGIGNITNAPAIACATNPHLLAGSPCIDAGANDFASGTDIDGQPRIFSGRADIGCDEYTPPCIGALGVAIHASWTNVAIGFNLPIEAVITGTPDSLVWQWGDGSRTTNLFLTAHAYTDSGTYEMVLTASNATGSASCTTRVCVAAASTRYVSLQGGHVPPFDSWANAATTIQAAIDIALPGDQFVLVSNGVYGTGGRAIWGTMTNRVVITKPICVRSVNGPAVTVIRGEGPSGDSAVRCAYVTNGAILTGFTLTNGATLSQGDYTREQCGGGAWCEPGRTLSNCTLTGNSADAGGGSYDGTLNGCTLLGNSARTGGGSYDGTLNGCMLTGNSASGDGGGSYDGMLKGCTLTGNSAYFGGGSYDSMLNDCTLSVNSASYGGGSLYGTLNHCTLSGNSAYYGGGGSYEGTLSNCALVGNSAEGGGGSCRGTLNNCTLAGNSAGYGGGSSGSTLINCIVFYNTARGANWYVSTMQHCCTTPDPGGIGNITNEPLFVAANDFRLVAGSPCINAGSNEAWMADARDLDGNPRIDAGRVDMGAYEYVSTDTDGDGMRDLDEYLAGTDPTNSTSHMGFAQILQPEGGTGTGIVVRWSSVAGKYYRLDRSTNLWTDPFTANVRSNIPAVAPMNTETDEAAVGQGPWYYRIGLEQ